MKRGRAPGLMATWFPTRTSPRLHQAEHCAGPSGRHYGHPSQTLERHPRVCIIHTVDGASLVTCDQRFSFTGAHFGDFAAVEDDAADQLHVEVAHVEEAAAGF